MKIIYNVVCLGAGGTGSFFLKEFARFIAAFERKNFDKVIYLSIIDGDHIEKKNLERQAFAEWDINGNKAVTMASAIKENFGLERVYAYPLYIDTIDQLKAIFNSLYQENQELRRRTYECKTFDILIGCSDNHRARQVMHEFFYSHSKTIFYYDAANEFSNGEVVFAGRHEKKLLGRPRADYFANVLTDTSPRASEISCGTVNITAPQHIATNMLAGNLLLSRLTQLIAEDNLEFGIAFFDSMGMFVNYYPDTETEKERENKSNGETNAEGVPEKTNQAS